MPSSTLEVVQGSDAVLRITFADPPISAGAVRATVGSALIQGIGTAWQTNLAGRAIWIDGASQVFTIQSTDTAKQEHTLTQVFAGTSGNDLDYEIRPTPIDISQASEITIAVFDEAVQTESPVVSKTKSGGGVWFVNNGSDGAVYAQLSAAETAALTVGDYYWQAKAVIGDKTKIALYGTLSVRSSGNFGA